MTAVTANDSGTDAPSVTADDTTQGEKFALITFGRLLDDVTGYDTAARHWTEEYKSRFQKAQNAQKKGLTAATDLQAHADEAHQKASVFGLKAQDARGALQDLYLKALRHTPTR